MVSKLGGGSSTWRMQEFTLEGAIHDERGSMNLAIRGSGGFGPQWGPGACPWLGGDEIGIVPPNNCSEFKQDVIYDLTHFAQSVHKL